MNILDLLIKKIIFISIPFIFILKLPYFEVHNIIFIIFFILILISIKKIKKIKFSFRILLLFFLFTINFFLNTNQIIEKNGIFIPNFDNNIKYSEYNKKLFELLEKKFFERYSLENINCDENQLCWENTSLKNIFSKNLSILNLYKKNYFEKKINNINHKNLSSAKIRMINSSLLNWSDWSNNIYIKRNNAPYFVIYDFNSNKYTNSDLCWKGNAIIISKNYKNLFHKKQKCIKIKKNLKIVFYNFSDLLEIKLNKNIYLKLLDILEILVQVLCFILLINIFVKKINKDLFKNILIISTFSSLHLIYTFYKRAVFEFGYYPLAAGMDGLVHEGYANDMAYELINLNIYEFLRGGESVYYYMPGLRYLLSIMHLFFGDTVNGTIIFLILFPVVIYLVFLKLKINKKFSFFFIILFIFFKIPHVGFSFSHFLRGGLTIYPETFASFFFFIFIISLINRKIFFSGLICSLIVFIRPNYFPIYFISLLYCIYIYIKLNNKNLLFSISGFLFLSLIPLHNYIYSNGEFVFLTSSAFIPVNLKISIFDYFNLFSDIGIRNAIIDHFLNLLTTGDRDNFFAYLINPLLLLNLIIFTLLNIKKMEHIIILFSMFSLGLVFLGLFYSNTGRYAYFPWLLVLISNILIFEAYYKKSFYYFLNINNKKIFNYR